MNINLWRAAIHSNADLISRSNDNVFRRFDANSKSRLGYKERRQVNGNWFDRDQRQRPVG
jgi:hypothetical protein